MIPSASLGRFAREWQLVRGDRIVVLPNPIAVPAVGDRDELRRRHGFDGPTLVFAGRLSLQKELDVLLRALDACEGVALVVAGDGPERARLDALVGELGLGDRVRFLGAQPRKTVLELLAAADAEVLSSGWENFPHSLIEGLAVGTPVIATGVGGVREIVTDGENGLLVPPGDPDALAAAIRRFFADGALRERLRAAAPGSVARLRAGARVRPAGGAPPGSGRVSGRPRLLLVGRTRYRLPLSESLRAKFDVLGERLDLRVLASGVDGAPKRDAMFELAGPYRPRKLDGALYFLGLPLRTRRELRRSHPDAVLVQGAHETWFVLLGRSLSGVRAPVILDVHGDWHSSTRLYGSPARRLLNPIADRVAVSALRRADAVRTISDYTTRLVRSHGVEPAAVFPAFMDLEPFLEPRAPLPAAPRALFVGVLEHYKGIDELAEAWRIVAPQVPGATLHLVGRGTRREVVERLVADLPDRTEWTEVLPTEGVARALDDATTLVLPSRSEGMGRVLVEAFCRGRPACRLTRGGDRRPRARRRERAARLAAGPAGPGRRAAPRPLGRGGGRAPGGRRRRQRGHLGGHAGGVRGAAGGAGRGTTIGACVPTASSRR